MPGLHLTGARITGLLNLQHAEIPHPIRLIACHFEQPPDFRYGLNHPPPAERGKGPDFNPVIYALDLLLPIVDFGQEKAYTPTGPYQWLSYLLIAAGWILATTIAAGVIRNLNRA